MPETQSPFSIGARALIRGLNKLERLTGSETFTWKQAQVLCVARTLNATNAWEMGGLADLSTLRLYVRKENFLTADSTLITVDSDLWTVDSDMPHPVAGRTLTFRGKVWRINSAREGATRAHYELDLMDSNR
jgi:hypothetical protein